MTKNTYGNADRATGRDSELLKSTLIFSAFGIFIPGFTAIGLFGFQMLLESLGLACHDAWVVLWAITIIGGLTLPVLFYRHISGLTKENFQNLKTRLVFFNLLEYTFIQGSLALLFTSGNTLCYGSAGQNGIEFAFAAWLALPILIGLSILFSYTLTRRQRGDS